MSKTFGYLGEIAKGYFTRLDESIYSLISGGYSSDSTSDFYLFVIFYSILLVFAFIFVEVFMD